MLVNTTTSPATTWTRLTYVGTATDNVKILTNDTTNPIEVLFVGTSSAPANAWDVSVAATDVAVYSPHLVTLGINTLSSTLTTSVKDKTLELLEKYAGTDNLTALYTDSVTNNIETYRIVLMPGEAMQEKSTTFGTGVSISIMYRYMTNVEVL